MPVLANKTGAAYLKLASKIMTKNMGKLTDFFKIMNVFENPFNNNVFKMNRKFSFLLVFCVLIVQIAAAKGSAENLSEEYITIAQSYADLKKYDKAVEFYKKAEKSPEYQNAVHYNLAQIYALQNDWVNCLKYLKPMYEKVPNNTKICIAYAYALASSGHEKAAVSMYEKIYLDNPDTPEYFFNYIRILIAAKKYKEAEKFLDEAVNKFPDEEDQKIINELKLKIANLINPPKSDKAEKNKKSNTGNMNLTKESFSDDGIFNKNYFQGLDDMQKTSP